MKIKPSFSHTCLNREKGYCQSRITPEDRQLTQTQLDRGFCSWNHGNSITQLQCNWHTWRMQRKRYWKHLFCPDPFRIIFQYEQRADKQKFMTLYWWLQRRSLVTSTFQKDDEGLIATRRLRRRSIFVVKRNCWHYLWRWLYYAIDPDSTSISTLLIKSFKKENSSRTATLFNRVFSHDVRAAMLVSQTSPVGVELLSYANVFFCANKFV